ncbi:hypothetical protein EYF80_001111 [Liparis tanakae]|uniref:Uncharacterized protein n=1 Tax=Liparis tanakae TaxID=230148 RepID=A0A4Z2JEV0_9TELE|nr:hypothetical protein EYF80_001111 [Liparis tanakae]
MPMTLRYSHGLVPCYRPGLPRFNLSCLTPADVGRRHGAKGPWRLEAVGVIQGGRRGAGPVGETRRPHPGRHEVQFGNPGEGNRGEVTLKLVDGLLCGGRLAHLRQAVEIKLRRATSSGSMSLNSPLVPSQPMHDMLALSERSSSRNCHS